MNASMTATNDRFFSLIWRTQEALNNAADTILNKASSKKVKEARTRVTHFRLVWDNAGASDIADRLLWVEMDMFDQNPGNLERNMTLQDIGRAQVALLQERAPYQD